MDPIQVPSVYSFALHAGTMENWTYDPFSQTDIEESLKEMAVAAGALLATGARAIDVVQSAVVLLEDHDEFNAGKGALEAGIVDGSSGEYGAVACVRHTKNPIKAARLVMDSGSTSFLVGTAVDDLSRTAGLEMVENNYFTTAKRLDHMEKFRAGMVQLTEKIGTVGAVALDIYGNLAAAGSTGGSTCKPLGRIGDTAIVGAGLIANQRVAVACSGSGEAILKANVSANIASMVSSEMPLDDAVRSTVLKAAFQSGGKPCAVIAIDAQCRVSIHSTGRIFVTATCSSATRAQASFRETTIPILEQHQFYQDGLLCAGLARYPTLPGQAILELQHRAELTGLDSAEFFEVFQKIDRLAVGLKQATGLKEYTISTDGGSLITFAPFQRDSKSEVAGSNLIREAYGRQIDTTSSNALITEQYFPVDLNGEGLNESVDICASKPTQDEYRLEFHQCANDKRTNKASLCVIWPTESHPSYLLPLGDKLVKSLASNPDLNDFIGRLFSILSALNVEMQIKNVSITISNDQDCHTSISFQSKPPSASPPSIAIKDPATYHNAYPGYLTTDLGPLCRDDTKMFNLVREMRKFLKPARMTPPRTWEAPAVHSIAALRSPWYQAMFTLQNTFYHSCIQFFQEHMSYNYAFAPLTTDCISSPMGLGSDSLPVQIPLHGQNTYLADSMQFVLEYMLRIQKGSRGVYYVNPSFRGEDPDSTHMNQFYHVECELVGELDHGMAVMEKFVVSVSSVLFEKHAELIESIAGTTTHIRDILKRFSHVHSRVPQVELDDAIKLCEHDPMMWAYVLPEAPEKGRKLTRKGERFVLEKYGGVVWLTMMDHLSVPFYQAYADKAKTKARCADLLLGIGETGGLGERHRTGEEVKGALVQHEVPIEPYNWYVDIREEKCLQTVGWGMGMERFMLWLLKHEDVRDIPIVPRLKHCKYMP
ncbi:hypothetical protein PENFLA_c027G02582 [Penicillium flavigenum]|uniref:Aminoacyl-transfer RNA synthetases class-II family profile domain-containing protein n=1 Tax=Penicillium flavigenum TaxID=254877 RepID=A0A1V6SSC1_9EURO|nr:hypothetical protein PENFLA_c027G02582 [Penicillium flavigenum]